MRTIISIVLLGLTIVLADSRDDFLGKICDKCEGCEVVREIGQDSDGDPIFNCEENCGKCSEPLCEATPRPRECKFCRKNEAVNKCAERCQRGCTFCKKTKACKDN